MEVNECSLISVLPESFIRAVFFVQTVSIMPALAAVNYHFEMPFALHEINMKRKITKSIDLN